MKTKEMYKLLNRIYITTITLKIQFKKIKKLLLK